MLNCSNRILPCIALGVAAGLVKIGVGGKKAYDYYSAVEQRVAVTVSVSFCLILFF